MAETGNKQLAEFTGPGAGMIEPLASAEATLAEAAASWTRSFGLRGREDRRREAKEAEADNLHDLERVVDDKGSEMTSEKFARLISLKKDLELAEISFSREDLL
mgnify:CR=1 FL=1